MCYFSLENSCWNIDVTSLKHCTLSALFHLFFSELLSLILRFCIFLPAPPIKNGGVLLYLWVHMNPFCQGTSVLSDTGLAWYHIWWHNLVNSGHKSLPALTRKSLMELLDGGREPHFSHLGDFRSDPTASDKWRSLREWNELNLVVIVSRRTPLSLVWYLFNDLFSFLSPPASQRSRSVLQWSAGFTSDVI